MTQAAENYENQFEVLQPSLYAIMPGAPAREQIPAVRDNPPKTLVRLMERLAETHYMAFVAVHGMPPQDVEVGCIQTESGETITPGYIASAPPTAPAAALDWVETFRAGLDQWADAEFADPLVKELTNPGPPATYSWDNRPRDMIISYCAMRLKKAGRTRELRNLAAYVGDDFPDFLNPDSSAYVVRRHRP